MSGYLVIWAEKTNMQFVSHIYLSVRYAAHFSPFMCKWVETIMPPVHAPVLSGCPGVNQSRHTSVSLNVIVDRTFCESLIKTAAGVFRQTLYNSLYNLQLYVYITFWMCFSISTFYKDYVVNTMCQYLSQGHFLFSLLYLFPFLLSSKSFFYDFFLYLLPSHCFL